jgi:DNA-binding NarL/FixJ family response regulator
MAFSGYLHRDPDYAALPSLIDEELLDERVTALRSGDQSVVNDIVTSMLRLVMGVVRDNYSNDDELIGVALLTLQESVIDASTALHDNNIIPYVLKKVRMRLKDTILEIKTSYSISARRIREKNAKGEKLPQRNTISEQDFHSSASTYDALNHNQHFSSTRLRSKNLIDPQSGQEVFELRDSLEKMVRSHRQQTVIDLKLQEYTYKEISEKLAISEATAMREIHDLRERYDGQT